MKWKIWKQKLCAKISTVFYCWKLSFMWGRCIIKFQEMVNSRRGQKVFRFNNRCFIFYECHLKRFQNHNTVSCYFFKNGPIPASFCLFSSFSHSISNDKFTIWTIWIEKSVDGVLGTQTRGGRSFQTNNTNFTTNQCETMSIQHTALEFEPTSSQTWVVTHNR